MRRYPWGDTVISLHTPAPNLSHGGGFTPDQLKCKFPQSGQVFNWGGGGTPDQLKSKVPPQSGQVFISGGGGRVVVEGYSRSTQIQIPSIWPSFHFQGVFQTNSNPKFQVLTKFSFSGGGGGWRGGTPDQHSSNT